MASPNSAARATSSGSRVSALASRRAGGSPSSSTGICSSSLSASRVGGSSGSDIVGLGRDVDAARHGGDRVPLGGLLEVVDDERVELGLGLDLALDEVAAPVARRGDVADTDDAQDALT